MRTFDYHRPSTLAEAVTLLSAGGEAALLAGGHTLLPAMKSRLRAPDALIDLARVPGLDAIAVEGDRLWIGAMATHAAVAGSAVVKAAIPSLAALAALIGDPQVRVRGTLGGVIANNDPAADYPAALLALDAIIETDRRAIPVADFLLGMFTTALDDGEIVTRAGFRRPAEGAYAKFRHPASRYAMAAVYAARQSDGWRVAVTGAGPLAFRWAAAEAALDAGRPVSDLAVDADGLNADIHATAAYRGHLCGVMLRQALGALI